MSFFLSFFLSFFAFYKEGGDGVTLGRMTVDNIYIRVCRCVTLYSITSIV
jgi:hypothetical protein